MTPDAHIKGKKNLPMMQTTDLSMRFDPEFGRISRHFHNNPEEFADEVAHIVNCSYLNGEVIRLDAGIRMPAM